MSEIADILDRAAEVVKEGWTQGTFARDATGANVPWGSPSATCFCAEGSIYRTAKFGSNAVPALAAFQDFLGVLIWRWNDASRRTQSEVVAKLREAAAKARGEQS
jgi:hypothetical protein